MRAEITATADGHGTLRLDGHDVATAVREWTLNCEPGYPPELTLDLLLIDLSTTAEVRVIVPEATAELLTRLGWTPPDTDA